MGKSNGLKQRLKQAAKRRARREHRPSATLSPDRRASAGDIASSAVVDSSSSQQAVLDAFVALLLDYDRKQRPIGDREVLAALRGMQRGYPSGEAVVVELYGRLTELKAESAWGTYPLRRAIDELIDLLRSYEDGRRDSRAGMDYLHSIAN